MNSTDDNQIAEIITHFLYEYGVGHGSAILIGVSGGADSVALLCGLNEVNSQKQYDLSCCYIDHGIRSREERRKDRDHVTSVAETFSVPLYIREIRPGMIEGKAHRENRSVEEVAREIRYSLFEELLESLQYDYLALGHHQDDQIETMVMRFFQGSGTEGIAGIDPVRESVIRPLLAVDKRTIVAYLEEKGIPFREDTTNTDISYLRNNVRHNLAPVVQQIFPGYKKSLLNMNEKMRLTAQFVSQQVRERVIWQACADGYVTSLTHFLQQPGIIRLESIYQLFNSYLMPGTRMRLPYRFVRTVLDDSAFHKGNVVCQGYGIALKVRGDTLVGMSEVALKRKKGYAIVVEAPGDYKLPQKICFHIEEKLLSSYSRDKIQLTKKLMKPPFLVRSRQPGDVIALQGGRKTIKKLLGEWKVPDDQRWEIPILEDRSGIIAVCGKPFGYKNRVAEKWKRCNIRVDEYIYEISFSA